MVRKAFGMIVFAGVFLVAGYILGTQGDFASAQAVDSVPTQQEELFAPFWETWDLLHTIYVDVDKLDDTALMEAALRGMLAAVGDLNTAYMDPREFEMANEDLQGSFEGIGAYVRKDEVSGALMIVSVMPDSPALRAGVLAGDAIHQVDGEDITHLDQTQMINRVRGPAGSTVQLGVRRQGLPGLIRIEVIRARIDVPSVESRMIGDVAYLRLLQFGAQTMSDQHAALEALLAQKPSGLILDLRGNPGGYLHTVVSVASEFMPGGPVLIERSATGDQEHIAAPDGLAESIPMVVLVDVGSASASELLAGALQDTGRATIVGTNTFGKGTVQTWRALSNGGGVRMTISRWYTPNGRTVDGSGLSPDVTVDWPAYAVFEGFDPQLEAALRVFEGRQVWATWPLPLPLSYFHVLP